jgi:hypothetical protein
MENLQKILTLSLNSLFIYSILIILKYVWLTYCAIIYKTDENELKPDIFNLIKLDLPISISYFIGFLLS